MGVANALPIAASKEERRGQMGPSETRDKREGD